MQNKFNPKITFKFIENLWQERDHRESEAGIKAVYDGNALPHSFTEKMFFKSLTAYRTLYADKTITTDKILETYRIYKGKHDFSVSQKSILDDIVTVINKGLTDPTSWIDYFVFIFRMTIESEVFPDYDIEMAKLLSNFILIMNDSHPIIMYCYSTMKMATLVRCNAKVEDIKDAMSILIARTESFNKKHSLVTLDEIKIKLYENIDYLRTRFGINQLYIFGSYAKNTYNEYSDLDLLCHINQEFATLANLKNDIARFVQEITGIDVDVLIDNISFDINQVPVDIFDEKIRVF